MAIRLNAFSLLACGAQFNRRKSTTEVHPSTNPLDDEVAALSLYVFTISIIVDIIYN
jgi:hypothetical protein